VDVAFSNDGVNAEVALDGVVDVALDGVDVAFLAGVGCPGTFDPK
jgi:hypothetical protein